MAAPLIKPPSFKNISLQKKLILSYSLLIFIPLAVVGFFAYNIAASSVKSEVSRYTAEVLQQVNDNIDNSVYELDRVTSILSSDTDIITILSKDKNRPKKEIIDDDMIMNEKINNAVNFRSNIEGLFIFSYNGEVYNYNGANNSIKLGYTFTRTRWYETMKSLKIKKLLLPTHMQDEILPPMQKKKVFTYIKEINDPVTRKPIGNILIDINTDVLKKIWDKLNIRQFQEFIIVDNNKTIIYHTNEKLISTQYRSSYISKILKSRYGSFTTPINNEPALITYNTSHLTNWTVISIVPVNILYKSITNLQYIVMFTVALCMLLSLVIAVILSRNITKPISTLRKLMKKAECGKFDISIPVESKDEIGELSASFNSMITEINNLIQTVYETSILKREAELNALQSQINPHFLYNTLQTIDIIAEDEGIDVISSICQSLSRIFRYSISRGKEIVTLSSEVEHVKDYIYIQKLRFRDKFDIVYDIEDGLGNNKMIKLVLQPLVENAIFHGIENKRGKCMIYISAKAVNEVIELVVEDTGLGMDGYQLDRLLRNLNEDIVHARLHGLNQRSIGIKNVHARIRLYFGDAYGVSVESIPNIGTKIKVTIPVITHEDGGMHYGN